MNYKQVLQHCRSLISQHSLSRDGFAYDFIKNQGNFGQSEMSKNSTEIPINVHSKLDMSVPIVIPDEEILDLYLKKHGIQEQVEIVFLTETFYGFIRFHKLLNATLNKFYIKTGGRYLKNEYSLFLVITYLAMIRLKELSFPQFAKFVRCFDPMKMSRLIGFLFDPVHLESELKSLWFSILDADFVKEHILSPIQNEIQSAQLLLKDLIHKADHGIIAKKSKKSPTSTQPFSLTVPRPRKLPEPQVVIPTFTKAKPIPKSVLQGGKEIKELQIIKEKNRLKAQEIYETAQKNQFEVAKKNNAERLDKFRQDFLKSQEQIMEKNKPVHFRKVPSNLYQEVPVKPTTSTILREDALVRKEKEKERKWLHDVEMGLKDEKEFEAWREELKLKEIEEKKLEIQKRKIEIKLLHEETFIAKQEKLQENRSKVAEIQAFKDAMKVSHEESKKETQLENKKKIEKIQIIQEGIQEAKEKILLENIKSASEMNLEFQAQKERKALELEQEFARKAELIKQIRLLEKALPSPGSIVKKIDLTETSGLGILGEMSILELQERLTIVKIQHQEMEQEKRDFIHKLKQDKQVELQKKMEWIDFEREKRKQNRNRLMERAQKIDQSRPTDSELEKLRAILEQKRSARLSCQQDDKLLLSKPTQKSNPIPKKSHEKWDEFELTCQEIENKMMIAS